MGVAPHPETRAVIAIHEADCPVEALATVGGVKVDLHHATLVQQLDQALDDVTSNALATALALRGHRPDEPRSPEGLDVIDRRPASSRQMP